MLLPLLLITLVTVVSTADEAYDVYWNIPTFMCHKYGILFNVSQYGISQNQEDQFKGEKVLILYDPGLFPAFLSDEGADEDEDDSVLGKQGNVVARNGGLPQLGDLSLHLKHMRTLIDEEIPDRNFAGVGVLDFESWRPTYRQNWASLNVYRDKSRALERRLHPTWSKGAIDKEAERRFEQSGRQFMQRTLQLVREMRPRASWGYYAFPYCFNYTPKNQGFDCPAEVKQENNDLGWLFESSDALFPSLYMSRKKLRPEQHYKFVYGRLTEARRLSKRVKPRGPDVMPYVWYRYYDEQEFLAAEDVLNSLGTPKSLGLRGAVLWGSSKDVSSKERCLKLRSYVHDTLGPTIRYIMDTPSDKLQDRIEGRGPSPRSTDAPSNFWATYFLHPIASILQSKNY